MSAVADHHTEGRRYARARWASESLLLYIMLVLISLGVTALGLVVYALWPSWPDAPADADAPALPITVGGVPFNVPPQAMRVAAQRAPGAQVRIDLVYLWPSLAPPDETAPPTFGEHDRVFVTIAVASALSPLDRLKNIYGRYVAAAPTPGPQGLALYAFRDGTPYQGEDIAFDTAVPDKFLVRCSRSLNPLTPGMCLDERRIGNADITVRFPRDWLTHWREVEDGVERLIAGLQAPSGS